MTRIDSEKLSTKCRMHCCSIVKTSILYMHASHNDDAKQTTAMKGNTMNDKIRAAIEASSKSGQITSVAVDCTAEQLEDLLLLTIKCDWEMCKIDDHKVDVWGWTDDTPENQVEFRLTVQCQPTPEEFFAEHAGECYSKIREAIASIDCGDCYPEVDEDGLLTGNLIPGDEPGYSVCDIDKFGSVRRHEHASAAVIAD